MTTRPDDKKYTDHYGFDYYRKILVTYFEKREEAEETISALKDFATNYVGDETFINIIEDFEKSLLEENTYFIDNTTLDVKKCYNFSAEMERHYDFVNKILEIMPKFYNDYKMLKDFYDQH